MRKVIVSPICNVRTRHGLWFLSDEIRTKFYILIKIKIRYVFYVDNIMWAAYEYVIYWINVSSYSFALS